VPGQGDLARDAPGFAVSGQFVPRAAIRPLLDFVSCPVFVSFAVPVFVAGLFLPDADQGGLTFSIMLADIFIAAL
jgi:hypothetical protein